MKPKHIFFAVIIIHFVVFACNTGTERQPTQLSKEDSLEIVRRDSIAKIKAKEEAERLAHLNRPWKLGYFTDSFGDRTDDKFIATEVEGTFSNSATTNSYLFVRILLKKDAAGILMNEYDRNRPNVYFIGSGRIMLKNSQNETLTVHTYSKWNQDGGLLLNRGNFTNFRNFIRNSEGKIQVVIQDEYSSVYRFTIDSSGFAEEYALI